MLNSIKSLYLINCQNQTDVEYWDDKIDWTKYRYSLGTIYINNFDSI